MLSKLLIVLLNFLLFSVVVYWLYQTIRDFFAFKYKQNYFTLKRFKNFLLAISIVGIPLFLIQFLGIDGIKLGLTQYQKSNSLIITLSIFIAFFISFVWLRYIWKLDIFERDSFKGLFFVFFLSAIFIEITCIPLYELAHYIGFKLNGNPITDFLYCMFVIGGIEELVKFIPFFLLLKFSKQINEPYDYILYASTVALGFAFAENIMYINKNIGNINARMFYATVAHMTFSSTIAYGLLLHKYRLTKYPKWLILSIFFGIAMFSHGFYDYWLINPWAQQFDVLTTVWFIITIHIWYTMKNNAINISPYFDKNIYIRNDKLRNYLISSLLGILMLSYVVMSMLYGKKQGYYYLYGSAFYYGFFIYYLAMGFSRFQVVKNYFIKFQIGFDIIIPRLLKRPPK